MNQTGWSWLGSHTLMSAAAHQGLFTGLLTLISEDLAKIDYVDSVLLHKVSHPPGEFRLILIAIGKRSEWVRSSQSFLKPRFRTGSHRIYQVLLTFGQIKSNVAKIPEMEERFSLLMEDLQSHVQHEYFRLNFVPSPVHMLKGLTPDVMLLGDVAFGR